MCSPTPLSKRFTSSGKLTPGSQLLIQLRAVPPKAGFWSTITVEMLCFKRWNAQTNPERYSDLQIRVSGWNVLWNNITKEKQKGFIRQAEALQ